MSITYISIVILLIIHVKISRSTNCSDVAVQRLCLDQETCDTVTLKKIEINSESGSEIPEEGDKDFTDGDAEEVVQFRPQIFNIKLSLDTPVNFTFTYKPAKNYPLELYYLGDLSVSMREHLGIFKTLGKDLPNNLTQLTKNYRLAYGSFLDKIAMPFYFTAPESYDRPCLNLLLDDCEPGYLFKHRLSFTKDADKFAEMVSNSKITANIDDLDGALDAILQILACEKKMGWTVSSRKIILLPTDSLLHTAGDGILAGAVLKPNSTCLIDDEGNHISPLTFDYPSVGEIADLLKEKKVNIIFAVKDKVKIEYYRQVTRELLRDSAFVGELEEKSGNILHLITKGFYNFARQVSFSVNHTESGNLDVKFFSDCDGLGVLNRTSTCYNVEENAVNFTVQLTLRSPPTKKQDLLFIEEKNINERVTLNITYLGICDCKNYQGEIPSCNNGSFRCGQCICDEGWTGSVCDEDCNENDNFDSCRQFIDGVPSSICHRNGNCVCGKCACGFPYNGKYCEYRCPVNNGTICSGLAQGKCVEGACECREGYTGEDCSCSTSTSNCKLFEGMDECSDNGDCVCNTCKCKTGFSGQYCEVDRVNNTLCDDYREFVEDAAANGTTEATKDGGDLLIDEVDDDRRSQVCGNTTCETFTYVGNSLCTINFCYNSGQHGAIHLLMTKNCYMTAGFKAMTMGIAVFVAILLGGLIVIACTKYRMYRLEQAEYRQFENERKMFNELNPIYKDPVTSYENPMRRRRD
ncbi:hypothetical protein NQ317_015826 [Molorchus minor]|uniref:Integrin beta n=1 Tax=Molorchus minor TaxID=1323400 RepID=A0ABQ9JNY4_9CUCU|nr:hypothetical protein NQ317_015826 [Molorchus minor]